jgi:molecular chaperone DnaK
MQTAFLNVTAKDKATNKTQSITIQGSTGLSKDDIAKDAERCGGACSGRSEEKRFAEAKNIAEQLIYTSEKALKDGGDKVPADVKTSVETKVSELRAVKDGADLDVIKKATEALSTEIQKIGQAAYSSRISKIRLRPHKMLEQAMQIKTMSEMQIIKSRELKEKINKAWQ